MYSIAGLWIYFLLGTKLFTILSQHSGQSSGPDLQKIGYIGACQGKDARGAPD